MSMDVLYSIIGNGKIIVKSSLHMTMIMNMLWNGYVETFLQFYMVSVFMWWRFISLTLMLNCYHIIYTKNKSITETTETYGAATYRKGQHGKGEVGQQQKDIRQVGEGKAETYNRANLCETKVVKETYEKIKQPTKREGNITNEKVKRYKRKAHLKGQLVRMGKDEGKYGKVTETYG